MSQESLIKFYKDLLYSLDCKTTEDDKILLKNDTPITIMMDKKEKQLLLPTMTTLKHGDWVNSVGFHPTCESPVAGQSQVISVLVRLIGFKIYDTIQNLTSSIITLGMKVEDHEKLTLHQLDLLKKVGSVTKNTEKLFLDVLKNLTGITGKHPLFTIRLHRGGIISEESFARTFVLTPSVIKQDLYRDVILKSHSETSRNALLAIYGLVFPEKLSYGSNHNAMPYLMVLLTAYYEIAVHLNRTKMLLDKYTAVPEISLSWYNDVKHLSSWSKSITILRGNTGDTHKTADVTDEPVVETPTTTINNSPTLPSIINRTPNLVVPEVNTTMMQNLPMPGSVQLSGPNAPAGNPTVVKGLGIALDIKPNKPVFDAGQQMPFMQQNQFQPQNQFMQNQFPQQNQFMQNQFQQQNQFVQNQFPPQNQFMQTTGVQQMPMPGMGNRILLR
jgi:hypothetical protein